MIAVRILMVMGIAFCGNQLQALAGEILLWDHSARMITTDNLRSSAWADYVEGSPFSLPFKEWSMERMLKENKTTLQVRLSFLVRDTSTTMVETVEDANSEGCLVDAQLPPNFSDISSISAGAGFKVTLRNRGTWSSVVVSIPQRASIFLKKIIEPFSENDLLVNFDFVSNEVTAQVSTRHRTSDIVAATTKLQQPLLPLQLWPQLMTFGSQREASNRFSSKTDWEVYSMAVKLGSRGEGWNLREDYKALQKGAIMFRMNDPPVRFAKVLRAKLDSSVRWQNSNGKPVPFSTRIGFSFTLARNWRSWYDNSARPPTDLLAPSIICMAKPLSEESRVNQYNPVGLRVWIRPDPTTGDNYLYVEIGDGEILTHRLVLTWPPIVPGVKYDGELYVFFGSGGAYDASSSPLFRLTTQSQSEEARPFLQVPSITSRPAPDFQTWVSTFGADFSSMVIGGPCRGFASNAAAVYEDGQFVVEAIEFTSQVALPSGAVVASSNRFYAPPSQAATVQIPSPPNQVLGFRKVNHVRGSEQKHFPRLVPLMTPMNFSEVKSTFAQGFMISGDIAVTNCQVYAWGRNGTLEDGRNQELVQVLPIISISTARLSLGIDCSKNLLAARITSSTEDTVVDLTDSRLRVGSSFQTFKVTLILPQSGSTDSDVIDLSLLTSTVRRKLSTRLPRSVWGTSFWYGRDSRGSRIAYGDRGWMVRNVEIATFQYVSCTQIGAKETCDTFTNCLWNMRLGCRQNTVVVGQNATFAPTLASQSPTTTTPSRAPTTADATPYPTTLSPTITTVTPSAAPSSPPTKPTLTPTASPTTSTPTSSPVRATNSPTYSPVEYEERTFEPTYSPVEEYEYEYEYESKTQTPTSVPVISPINRVPTSLSPNTRSPTSLSPTTRSPTSPSPTTRSPTTPSPTTQTPTSGSPTTRTPTSLSPTSRAPTNSKTSDSPTTSSTSARPTPSSQTKHPSGSRPTTSPSFATAAPSFAQTSRNAPSASPSLETATAQPGAIHSASPTGSPSVPPSTISIPSSQSPTRSPTAPLPPLGAAPPESGSSPVGAAVGVAISLLSVVGAIAFFVWRRKSQKSELVIAQIKSQPQSLPRRKAVKQVPVIVETGTIPLDRKDETHLDYDIL